MKTRTQKLAKEIDKIYKANKTKIDALPNRGPQGGINAANIPGWSNYGNGAITRAANIASIPTMRYWSGSAPTPSTALPSCVYDEITAAYNRIFKA